MSPSLRWNRRPLAALHPESDLTFHIIEKTKLLGASLAGIASVTSLDDSPSYKIHRNVERPVGAKSCLVLALAHEVSQPELDWWGDKHGGSPGNRQLGSIAKNLAVWLNEELNINAWPLPYHVEEGGIFLKDAAVLAGLGTMGKNNLLVTPEFGPRVRLRAVLFDEDLRPAGPTDFAPCETCDMPCRQACPQKAFRKGPYSRASCNKQMKMDEMNRVISKEPLNDSSSVCIKYCRDCELACPIGS